MRRLFGIQGFVGGVLLGAASVACGGGGSSPVGGDAGTSTATGGAPTTSTPTGGTTTSGTTTTLATGGAGGAAPLIDMVPIPAGSFVMGDHMGFTDPKHPSDEIPLHPVSLTGFQIARTETTCAQALPFAEESLAAGALVVQGSLVVGEADGAPWFETAAAVAPSCLTWDGAHFGITPGREQHPMSTMRWIGAAAYANWYGARLGLPPCYTLPAGTTDFTITCVRLPTEAEWEYAARGGITDPYATYPWGDATDPARVNWVESGDPWEGGPEPRTTPVGFFDGSLRQRADHAWPAAAESYQTLDGKNGFGLYDVAGNVWEWVNDWYGRDYYASSPVDDPQGPAAGDPMPDGKPYHGLRGGSCFNKTLFPGDHERVSNRDPAYFRGKYLGKDDPDGPWFHIGFRLALQQR